MRLSPSKLLVIGAAIVGPSQTVQAQVPIPDTPQSESTGSQDPRSTGSINRSNEPLSEKLSRTDGVIRPPEDIAPDMSVRPPVPDPGTTLIIPPPGTPGGDQTMDPK